MFLFIALAFCTTLLHALPASMHTAASCVLCLLPCTLAKSDDAEHSHIIMALGDASLLNMRIHTFAGRACCVLLLYVTCMSSAQSDSNLFKGFPPHRLQTATIGSQLSLKSVDVKKHGPTVLQSWHVPCFMSAHSSIGITRQVASRCCPRCRAL